MDPKNERVATAGFNMRAKKFEYLKIMSIGLINRTIMQYIDHVRSMRHLVSP